MLAWDPTTRSGRLAALAEYLRMQERVKEKKDLVLRLTRASELSLPQNHEDQAAFAIQFCDLLRRAASPVLLPWDEYRGLKSLLDKVRKEINISDDETSVGIKDTLGSMRSFATNLELSLNLMRPMEPGPIRILTALSGIIQLRGLLREVLRPAHTLLIRGPSRETANPRLVLAQEATDRFLNLLWFPPLRDGPGVGFGNLRNAWTHGRAIVEGDALVLTQKDTSEPARKLSSRDLALYLIVGKLTWEAFVLDSLVTMCVSIPHR